MNNNTKGSGEIELQRIPAAMDQVPNALHQPPVKKKISKSRKGCLTCKKKRLKCGEERPFCLNCQKKNVVCGGYTTPFRWKSFDTINQKMSKSTSTSATITDNKNSSGESSVPLARSASDQPTTNNTLQQGNSSQVLNREKTSSVSSNTYSNLTLQKALEVATVSLTGKSAQEIAIANMLIATGKNPELASSIALSMSKLTEESAEQNETEGESSNTEHSDSKKSIEKEDANTKVKSEDDDIANKLKENFQLLEEENGEVKIKVEEEEKSATILSSLTETDSKAPPSPSSKINSPFDMPSPNDYLFQNLRQSEYSGATNNAPSPLSVFKSLEEKIPLSPGYQAPLTPGNPLYDILSHSTGINGAVDSPKLMAAISENPAALEQYQSIINSPAFSIMKSAQSPGPSQSNTSDQNKRLNNIMSPGFSALITAFTNFENDPLSAPSPANFELLPYNSPSNNFTNNGTSNSNNNSSNQNNSKGETPVANSTASPSAQINEWMSVHKKNSPGFNQALVPHSILTSGSSNYEYGRNGNNNKIYDQLSNSPSTTITAYSNNLSSNHYDINSSNHTINLNSTSPQSADSPLFYNKLPKSIEINDQRLKMLSAFDRYTCGIMSMKNGPTENPWRTLLLPLSQEYTVMFNAISAMTCFHVARGDSELRSQGMKHMKNAIVELVHGLKDKKIPSDVALATCLALAISESWERHISTGIAHLKGARSMILQILNSIQASHANAGGKYISSGSDSGKIKEIGSDNGMESHSMRSRSNSMNSTTSSRSMTMSVYNTENKVPRDLQFLFNAWIYFDVLARMTSDETDDSEESNDDKNGEPLHSESDHDEKNDGFYSSGHKRKRGLSSSSSSSKRRMRMEKNDSTSLMEKFRTFNLDGGDEVDPLLGVGQSLFPIVSKVATLISKIRKENRPKNTLSTISQAVELKNELERWQPEINHQKRSEIEDPLFDLTSAVSTAETYRYSTLLYLHQAVPEIPSLSSHKLSEKVLMLLAAIPSSSRTCIAHIFPLLVASCEATPGDEREWVRDRWELLSRKMWIGNIDRALEVVKEVWSRKDIMQKRRSHSKSTSSSSASSNTAAASSSSSTAVGGGNNADSPNSENGDGIIKLAAHISGVANGIDSNGDGSEEDDRIKSWTHWTTVMKDWGWEVLLA